MFFRNAYFKIVLYYIFYVKHKNTLRIRWMKLSQIVNKIITNCL